MGGRNRTYLSQGWTGVDDKQMVRKKGSSGAQLWVGSLCGISAGSLWSPPPACSPGHVMSRSGGI